MKKAARAVFGVLALCMLLCGCASGGTCTLTQTDTSLSLAFDAFTGTQRGALTLCAGDELSVCIERQSGRVDLSLAGESSVYTGDDAQSGSFSVLVPADGVYTLTLTGTRADGSVTLTRAAEAAKNPR